MCSSASAGIPTSILRSMMAVGGNLYSVAQFENPLPSVAYLHQLSVSAGGDLAVTPGSLTAIDFSAYGGIVNSCAGSTAPWQCHLGGEENDIIADSRDFVATFFPGQATVIGSNPVPLASLGLMMRYFGIYPSNLTASAVVSHLNPYMCVVFKPPVLCSCWARARSPTDDALRSPHMISFPRSDVCHNHLSAAVVLGAAVLLLRYGYHFEVCPKGGRSYTAVKHMAMGRSVWELAYVMPDNRTVYGTSDMPNGPWIKFITSTAGDLSSGSLFCATFTQTSSAGGGSFSVAWKQMSQDLTNAQVLGWVNTTLGDYATQLTFDDVFITAIPTSNTSGACPEGFTSVNVGYSYRVGNTTYYNECLRLNPANPNAAEQAATLETVRYAGACGGGGGGTIPERSTTRMLQHVACSRGFSCC